MGRRAGERLLSPRPLAPESQQLGLFGALTGAWRILTAITAVVYGLAFLLAPEFTHIWGLTR